MAPIKTDKRLTIVRRARLAKFGGLIPQKPKHPIILFHAIHLEDEPFRKTKIQVPLQYFQTESSLCDKILYKKFKTCGHFKLLITWFSGRDDLA